ncbi:hypothetical protein ACF1G5_04410 [Streptomyces coeruleorubidus]|uniref:hypothetical protein n=1 Tax=Streptomyces coeruleorubidus TaxID=116188 RepID=UPI0036FF501D
MLPGTSTSATVPDSATRDRTPVLPLFSLSGRLRPRDTALGALPAAGLLRCERDYGTAYAPATGSLLPASDDDAVPVPPPLSPSGSRRP